MVKQNLDSTTAGAVQAEQKTRHKVRAGREHHERENCKRNYIVVHNRTVLLIPEESKPALPFKGRSSASVHPPAHTTPTSGWERNCSAPRTDKWVRERTLLKTSHCQQQNILYWLEVPMQVHCKKACLHRPASVKSGNFRLESQADYI